MAAGQGFDLNIDILSSTDDLPEEFKSEVAYFMTLLKILLTEENKLPGEERSLVQTLLNRCNDLERQMIKTVEQGKLHSLREGMRTAFSKFAAIKAIVLFGLGDDASLRDALRTIDTALIAGAPIDGLNVFAIAEHIHQKLGRYLVLDKRILRKTNSSAGILDLSAQCDEEDESMNVDDDIGSEECPSFLRFLQEYHIKTQPVKLLQCMNGWSATVKWKYLGYLKRAIGLRTVPVEFGDYRYEGAPKLVVVSDYLEDLLQNKSVKDCGYLAQYHLFDQEPKLMKDVIVPDYCGCSSEGVLAMCVWIGPAGTKTPLHYDADHNILAQVLGRKRIMLFSPNDSPNLYAREDRLKNNSQMDVFKPDLARFPKFSDAHPLICTLHPGEMLYIPSGWWHAVESLDISISVNFFF